MIKKSNCCNEPLISLMSLDARMCVSCGKHYEFKLKKNQKPLIKHQR